MLPGSDKLDEPNRQTWSQSGLVSAQAAFARSQESEREYEDFVRAAESLVQRLRHREEQLAKLGKISEQINLGLTLDEVLTFLYEELREFNTVQPHRCGLYRRGDWARGGRLGQVGSRGDCSSGDTKRP